MFDEYKVQIEVLKAIKKFGGATMWKFEDSVFVTYNGASTFRIDESRFFLDKSKLTTKDYLPWYQKNEKDKLLEISDILKQTNSGLLNILKCDTFTTHVSKSLLDLFGDDYEFYSQGPESVIKCFDKKKREVYGMILPVKFNPFPEMETQDETAEQVVFEFEDENEKGE